MLDNTKIARFIAAKRKHLGLTQADIAQQLKVSFQAVSKWENGTLPNVEILAQLAKLLGTSVDAILAGQEKTGEAFSYRKAGVDIAYTDELKKEMALYLGSEDERVLNGLGPFASLYDISTLDVEDPVLVLKSEEPGSKQKLAMVYGYSQSICHDMINHLVNDILVMGARPLAVLDTIVCGNAEKETIRAFIKGISESCRENGCSLVGGETSIQPEVVEKGTYILTASIAGIVSRQRIIDGSAIREGDVVLAVASNGLHTNGYTLVRLLMERMPHILSDQIDGQPFIQQIMKPHTPYFKALQALPRDIRVHGMAHITGGGIAGNLIRILPQGLQAGIDLDRVETLPIFSYLKHIGDIEEREMLATFNCGVGLVLVVGRRSEEQIVGCVGRYHAVYPIGEIRRGERAVDFSGHIHWS